MKMTIFASTLDFMKEHSGIQQLSLREKFFLSGAAGVLLLLGLFHFGLSPYLQSRALLQQSIVRKEKELLEMKLLQQEYLSLKRHEGGLKELLSARAADFSLFAFLDRQAQIAQVKKQITYMKPSVVEKENGFDESLVEMKLEDVTLEQMVALLKLIESKEQVVSIKRISIQKDVKRQGYLDVLLQIVTFMEQK